MRLYDFLGKTFRAKGLSLPVAVDITPVARLYPDEPTRHTQPWLAYPVVRPPWPLAWLEFEVPRQTPERRAAGVMVLPPGWHVGTMMGTEESNAFLARGQIESFAKSTGVTIPAQYASMVGNPAHIVHFTVHVGPSADENKVINFQGMFFLKRDGGMVGNSIIAAHFDERAAQLRSYPEQTLMINLHALALLNCKNISVVDRVPDPKVSRARARRGKPPGEVYKTLVIKVPGEKVYKPFTVAGPGSPKGQHIVRGHFAHYTAEKPLFGRLTGTFYHPMHVRGRNKDRTIVKDYRLVKEEAA